MKKINLEEILWKSFHNNGIPKPTHTLAEITQKAMKEACRQTLELAAENVKLDSVDTFTDIPEGVDSTSTEDDYIFVNKESITNTINQVE